MNYRSRRFLIDEIDERLGGVEKELKFDKAVIAVGIVLLVAFSVVLALCASTHPVLCVVSIMMIIFSAALIVLMVKEYLEDLKKLKV